LCDVAGDTSVQVGHLFRVDQKVEFVSKNYNVCNSFKIMYGVNGVAEAGCADSGNAGSSAVAISHQCAGAGVDVVGHRISVGGVEDGLASRADSGLCDVIGDSSVLVGNLNFPY
jgi:hypothetical protein